MTGPFNTIKRESESTSHEATSRLFGALALLFRDLEKLERSGMSGSTNQNLFKRSNSQLTRVRDLFADVSKQLDLRILTLEPEDKDSSELSKLYRELETFGYDAPLYNYQMGQIAAIEVSRLQSVVASATVYEDQKNWYTFSEITDAVGRVLRLGMIISRIAALTPARKQNENATQIR